MSGHVHSDLPLVARESGVKKLVDGWETYTLYIERLVMSNNTMHHDDYANGPYSLGGFKGRSSKKNAKWIQKGASGKSSSSVSTPIQIFAAALVGVPALAFLGVVAFIVNGHLNG